MYILLLKGPHISSFLLVTLCCPKWNMLGSWLLITLNSLCYPRRKLTIRMESFHLSLFLVPWVAGRLVPFQLRLSTPGAMFCFLVFMAQQGPLWGIKRKDRMPISYAGRSLVMFLHSLKAATLLSGTYMLTCGSTVPRRGGLGGIVVGKRRERGKRKKRESFLHFKHMGIFHMCH